MPVAEVIRYPLKKIADKLGKFLFVAAGLAMVCLVLTLLITIDNHKVILMSHIETLQTELRKTKTEYDLKQKEIETRVTKRMGPKH